MAEEDSGEAEEEYADDKDNRLTLLYIVSYQNY